MHNPVRAQYPMFSLTYDLRKPFNTSQYENENFPDYFKRFKWKIDVVKIKLVIEFLDTFVTNQQQY